VRPLPMVCDDENHLACPEPGGEGGNVGTLRTSFLAQAQASLVQKPFGDQPPGASQSEPPDGGRSGAAKVVTNLNRRGQTVAPTSTPPPC
jgi:hypothetical protein